MLKNYLKTAWRSIQRNRSSSVINIAGLSLGLTCVILILLYIQDELKFDRFLKDSKRIYQVNLDGVFGGQSFYIGNTPPPVGAALVSNYPEIETSTRVFKPGDAVVSRSQGDQLRTFTESRVFGVDSNFLQVFDYALEQGNAATCLSNTNSIVLTKEMARKYFGDEPAMGKTLSLFNDHIPFTVTGILKDIPEASTLQFDFLTPMAYYGTVRYFTWSWVWCALMTYVKVNPQVAGHPDRIAALEAKFPEMVRVQAAPAFRRIEQPYEEFLKKGGRWDFHLQPLTDVHLHSAGIQTTHTNISDIKYVYIFAAIGIIILLLACVNFMNLSTARSGKRSREVGIRKVLGGLRFDLINQFMMEAVLISLSALAIALVLASLLIGPFNGLAGKKLVMASLISGPGWWILLITVILAGLLAGSYPALYLSSFNPVKVLKGVSRIKNSFANLFIRNGLVVFQFAASTALIVCTIIIYQQLEYARHHNPGFNNENVLIIRNADRLKESEKSFRDELKSDPGILDASITTGIPAGYSFNDFYWPETDKAGETVAKDIALSSFMVDDDFIPSLQMTMKAGRPFSREFTDSDAVILNEAAVSQIGWKNPIGQHITYPGGDNQRFTVIGVVKNFNTESIHSPVGPFALFNASSKSYDIPSSYVLARLRPGEVSSTLARVEAKWKSFSKGMPFDYSFLDTEFETLYRSEKQMGVVFGLFTFLSILVACLGLFGLAAYTAEQRLKEIGVRKVLGATTGGLVTMLSKGVVKMILLAEIIGFPAAWYFMHQWLQDYAPGYRIHIGWWIFFVAGMLALVIALGTVSFQAVRAATSNPVSSLRSE